jgi:hypothetical protein
LLLAVVSCGQAHASPPYLIITPLSSVLGRTVNGYGGPSTGRGAFCPTMITGIPEGKSPIESEGWTLAPQPTVNPASFSAAYNGSARKSANVGSTTYNSVQANPILCECILASIPASRRVFANWAANRVASKSLIDVILTASTTPRRACNLSYCSLVILLGANRSSSLTRSSCASSASLVVSATFSSDLRLSSLSRLNAILLNWISPETPSATKELETTDPHLSQKESYEGWIPASITSAIRPTTTSPPQSQPQDSHDSPDSSRSPSLAFLTPFLRRHAGKGFRGFWIGIAIGSLIWALLFGLWLVLGQPQ